MKKLTKVLAPLVGGVLFATLLLSSGIIASATPPAPTPADPTTCVDCQTIQDEIDTAYADLDAVLVQVSDLTTQVEDVMDQLNPVMGGTLLVDDLTAMTVAGELNPENLCVDYTVPFPYYSSFSHDGALYCFNDETQYNDFFDYLITMDTDHLAGANAVVLEDTKLQLFDLWVDEDTDPDDIEDLLALISELAYLLGECETTNCPDVVECPDCESIAADLATAMDDLDALETDADALDAELAALETEIDGLYDQLDAWETLKADFEAMIEDAGGMHGADCDGFEPASGQAWGIAHNFGDVEWCFTSEGQIEDMIQNLDDYWQTNSSSHLPSEEALNAELDTLMNDYFDKLDEYFDVLDLIDAANAAIDLLITDLEDCLAELQALQDIGECLDQDIAAMQDAIDAANGDLDDPFVPTPPAEEPPAEEPAAGPEDAEGHWGEEFIDELFNADIVSGDSETGLYRPDDEIIRAEASKVVTLAHEDDTPDCDSFFDVFTDVEFDAWFCPYVDAAQLNGYFNGYDDGTFKPANSILRGEAAAVILRVLDFDVPQYTEYSFPDIEGYWFADYAEKAKQCGIFDGRLVDGEYFFAGDETITRAEFAKIVDIAIFRGLEETECADYVAPEAA